MTKQERIAKIEAEIAEKTAELERVKAEREDGRVRGETYYWRGRYTVDCFPDQLDERADWWYALGLAAKTAPLAQHYFNRACARERVIAACEALGGGRNGGWVPTKQEERWVALCSVGASEISLPLDLGIVKTNAFFQKHSADLDLIYGEEPKV